jgi:hypothetical protein
MPVALLLGSQRSSAVQVEMSNQSMSTHHVHCCPASTAGTLPAAGWVFMYQAYLKPVHEPVASHRAAQSKGVSVQQAGDMAGYAVMLVALYVRQFTSGWWKNLVPACVVILITGSGGESRDATACHAE